MYTNTKMFTPISLTFPAQHSSKLHPKKNSFLWYSLTDFRCPHSLITFLPSFTATAAYGLTWSLTVTVEILWASILNNGKSFKVFSWIYFLKTRMKSLKTFLFFDPQQHLFLLRSSSFMLEILFVWWSLDDLSYVLSVSCVTFWRL